jgi:hypothetical protein
MLSVALGVSLAMFSSISTADDYRDTLDGKPSAGAMAFDLVIVRPVSLVATVLGTGLFMLSLPLALIQGERPSAPAQKLVVEPAKFTFSRPLGVME